MGTRRARSEGSTPPGFVEFSDFVVQARRNNPRRVEVRVTHSPVESLSEPVQVAFSDSEARRLRDSFRSSATEGGRMLINVPEATAIGKRLAQVLLPPPVFSLLARSLSALRGGGLRVRLALDESLIDLPWEYVYRPDRLGADGLSGFLLYDPSISLVRLAAHPRLKVRPIRGAAPLHFVGALWEGGVDTWEVRREFAQLRRALRPVADLIEPRFEVASDVERQGRGIPENTAIFHYAGHCGFERDGRAYLVQEMPASGDLEQAPKLYVDDLARVLARTETRVVVLSACNSGFWSAAEPLVESGVPVVVGVNGAVASISTIEFCTRLYESLALGLSLDEAADRARLAVMEWDSEQSLFDWGLYMIYMASPRAVLFPRAESSEVTKRKTRARKEHKKAAAQSIARARALDGMNFGEIMSETDKTRVLILGRFTARRMRMLDVIKYALEHHPNRYVPEVFKYPKPATRDLTESVIGFAALSRFVVADITEPRAIQAELQAIAPTLPSVPIVPIIAERAEEYAMFPSVSRRPNVAKPTLRYRDEDDLRQKVGDEVVPVAEAMRNQVRPAP